MNEQLKKYITAISAALFLVMAVSGLAMFFHVGEDLVKEMHQWLAVAFVAAVALHAYRNWGAMMTSVRRKTIVAPLALAAVAAPGPQRLAAAGAAWGCLISAGSPSGSRMR